MNKLLELLVLDQYWPNLVDIDSVRVNEQILDGFRDEFVLTNGVSLKT